MTLIMVYGRSPLVSQVLSAILEMADISVISFIPVIDALPAYLFVVMAILSLADIYLSVIYTFCVYYFKNSIEIVGFERFLIFNSLMMTNNAVEFFYIRHRGHGPMKWSSF